MDDTIEIGLGQCKAAFDAGGRGLFTAERSRAMATVRSRLAIPAGPGARLRMTTPRLTRWITATVATGFVVAIACAAEFQSLFDGQSLKGWHVSAKTGHSRASGNASGGKWVVQDGAIVGSQDIPGNGGIVLTDELFGDFEVELEMNNDFGPDSGLFLRSTEDGKAYQAMIDYHGRGNVMGVYLEGLGGGGSSNFNFDGAPDKIKVRTNAFPLSIKPEDWPKLWKHGQWNKLRARIVGNPPTISTWIGDVKIMEWTDKEKRHPDKGSIALQVHGGGDLTKQSVRYRNIKVKRLDGAAK